MSMNHSHETTPHIRRLLSRNCRHRYDIDTVVHINTLLHDAYVQFAVLKDGSRTRRLHKHKIIVTRYVILHSLDMTGYHHNSHVTQQLLFENCIDIYHDTTYKIYSVEHF
jgi:hypothetical protein